MPTMVPQSTSQRPDIVRNDLFTLQAIPGKGKGLIASQTITTGTCLISERPLFTTADIDPSASDVEKELARIVKSLPRESQLAFLSLHNSNPGREPFSNIVQSNGYPLGVDSDIGGIFVNIAWINYSCWANTQQAWNNNRQQETAYTMRRIEQGEEITIAYTIGGPSQERKAKLREFFRFECACEICSCSTEEEQRKSDEQHRRVQQLDGTIGGAKRVKQNPKGVLDDCAKLLQLYEELKITDNRLQRLYYDAFPICIMYGDKARAKGLARRCVEARTVCEGDDSADVRKIIRSVKAPEKHASFGTYSTKWKHEAEPEGLQGGEYERWLWRIG